MRTPRLTLVAAVAAITLGVAGCTGEDAPPAASAPAAGTVAGGTAATAVQLVNAAPEAAQEAGSSRISVESVSSTPQGDIRVVGEGVVDNTTTSAELTLTPQLPAGAGSGAENVGPIQMRVVDGSMFLAGLPDQADGTWLRQPLPAMGAQGGLGGDPTETLRLLRAVADVQEAGTATVRGVQTTRYTGSIEIARLLEQPGGDSPQLAQAVEQLRAAGVEQLPVEVFLDDQGRPVRTVQTLELTVQGTPLSTTTTTELYDWGVEVDVQAPPADQVTDAPPAPAAGGAGGTAAGTGAAATS